MKNKLIEYILNVYPGMQTFRKEYAHITDKMLIEDARMLIKLFNNTEESTKLVILLNEFIQSRR